MRTARQSLIAAAVALAVIAFPLVVSTPTYQNFAILALMIAQLGVAWNILGGYAGQISLGHAVFYGIGAYTSATLVIKFGISPWFGMLAGGALAVVFALAMGWPCFRLRGHYFAMATIAVAEIAQVIVTNWSYLGGAVGLSLPMENPGWANFVFNQSKVPYYYIAAALLAITLGVSWALERSYLGYYFRAIKDEPDAARSVGVSLRRYKLVALAVSSFLTALGGTLYAQKELFIDPGSVMATSLSIKIALVAILGGVGSLYGPVIGAVLLTAIEEGSRMVFGGTGQGTDLIIYSLLIIGTAVFSPDGIVGLLRKWQRPRYVPLPEQGD
jgi:branched-chain amino acid transport system permease protein